MPTYNRELLAFAGQNGALAAPRALRIAQLNRTHVPISVSITAGTATVKISGRNSDDDAWVELTSVEESDAPLVQWMPQMKAELTASAGATGRVTASDTATEV